MILLRWNGSFPGDWCGVWRPGDTATVPQSQHFICHRQLGWLYVWYKAADEAATELGDGTWLETRSSCRAKPQLCFGLRYSPLVQLELSSTQIPVHRELIIIGSKKWFSSHGEMVTSDLSLLITIVQICAVKDFVSNSKMNLANKLKYEQGQNGSAA